jgi:RNA polymerase sigma factor (sigma-70 family)
VKEELDAVVEQFLPRIKRLARRLHAKYPSVAAEDLEQEGKRGLLRAWDEYDPAKGNLGTFIHPWIKGGMLMHVRKDAATHRYEREAWDAVEEVLQQQSISGGTSLAEAIYEVADAYAIEAYSRRTAEDELLTREALSSVNAFLAELSERDREFCRYRFVEQLTLDEVGEHLGLSKFQMCRDEKRLRDQLRLYLARRG